METQMTDEVELKAMIDALKTEVAELKARLPKPEPVYFSKPVEIRDLTAGMSMPPEAMRDHVKGVDDRLMADLRGDAWRRSELKPLDGGSARPVPSQNGWVAPAQIDVPGGQRAQDLIEAGVNSYLPHGRGKPKDAA
jgi:hypothetical protein